MGGWHAHVFVGMLDHERINIHSHEDVSMSPADPAWDARHL